MRKLLLALSFVAAFGSQALANWTGKDATPATITFYNPVACTSVVCTPVVQLTDGTNQVTLTTAGADAVSNTQTGLPVYARNVIWNGTTWDRWTGLVKTAAGGIAAGSGVDGWDLQAGTTTDAAVTAGASGTASGKLRAISRDTGAAAAAAGTPTDTPCTAPASATSCTIEALLKALLNTGQYPSGATAISASNVGSTAATTATLAGTAGKTTYICSYSVRANATAATTVQNTLTGILGGTDTHQFWVAPNASGIGIDEQIFNPCHPASAANTGIAVVSGAPGSGGLVSVTAKGFQL